MAIYKQIAMTIEQLDNIETFDRIMFNARICNQDVLNGIKAQDELLQRLERLDYDAYIAYICGEQDVLDKYYRFPKEVTA